MREWIDHDLARAGRPSTGEERRVGGGRRVLSKLSSRGSLSPMAKMKKRGEEFLKKIETLKENLHLEGKQI